MLKVVLHDLANLPSGGGLINAAVEQIKNSTPTNPPTNIPHIYVNL
jgi:hypothetical protein